LQSESDQKTGRVRPKDRPSQTKRQAEPSQTKRQAESSQIKRQAESDQKTLKFGVHRFPA